VEEVREKQPLNKKTLTKLQDHLVTSSTAAEKQGKKEITRKEALKEGERDWKRKHLCFICNASGGDIPRHLRTSHSDNELVKEVLKRPKKSKERRSMWKVLINRGSYAQNIKAKEVGGEILVVRRSSKTYEAKDYVACIHCFGYFKKKDMWRHAKNCSASISIMTTSSTCAKTAKEHSHDFFDKLKLKDDVNILVKNDSLLNCLAVSLLEEGKCHTDVSYTVRLLAKLLMKIREIA
ncbi:LOW QUALITY PROTEIN: hypothetical protein MAR_003586, partial [Mya arenaria]